MYVHSYSTAGDGGGGYFAWKTTAELPAGAAANTGIWFAGPLGGGLWERQFSIEGPVNVRWFGAKGDFVANDTTAIQKAVDFASSFGYSVFIPKGIYLVETILLKSNVSIFGEGDLSVLQLLNDQTQLIFFVDTQNGSTVNNIQNVRISDLKFYSTFLFAISKHFLCLNGVSNFIIERCLFMQFRGDAIYLGAGFGASTHITHNENITIRDCRFDGVGKTNRNAISVLDGSNVIIEKNYFTNCTTSSMAGPIDIEPDPPGAAPIPCNEILRDIIIQNNYFYNVGGISCCSVVLPPNPFTVSPSGIYFLNNYLENVTLGFHFKYEYVPISGIDTKIKISYFVENNVIKNASSNGIQIVGACQAKISGNYINSVNASVIGLGQPSQITTDVILENNYFDKCGTSASDGYGLVMFNCKRIKFIANTFNDCGNGNGTFDVAILFNAGTSDYISFDNNLFLSPTGKTLFAFKKQPGHTFANPRNNRYFNNQLISIPPNPAGSFLYINDNNFGLASGISPAISVTIPHNLGSIPQWATVQPQSNNVSGIKNISVDATNITVTFTALPVGLVNLWWSVQA